MGLDPATPVDQTAPHNSILSMATASRALGKVWTNMPTMPDENTLINFLTKTCIVAAAFFALQACIHFFAGSPLSLFNHVVASAACGSLAITLPLTLNTKAQKAAIDDHRRNNAEQRETIENMRAELRKVTEQILPGVTSLSTFAQLQAYLVSDKELKKQLLDLVTNHQQNERAELCQKIIKRIKDLLAPFDGIEGVLKSLASQPDVRAPNTFSTPQGKSVKVGST